MILATPTQPWSTPSSSGRLRLVVRRADPGRDPAATEIIDRVAPVERIRLVNSGTEATMSAVRLARGFTGRAKIVKFSAATTAT